jgi:hypothetical protein
MILFPFWTAMPSVIYIISILTKRYEIVTKLLGGDDQNTNMPATSRALLGSRSGCIESMRPLHWTDAEWAYPPGLWMHIARGCVSPPSAMAAYVSHCPVGLPPPFPALED